MQQQIYLRYKYFSFPSLTIVARHVQLLRWNRATIASQLYRLDQSALLSNDTRRRFPCSTSFHFEGRAPFLLARIASMVITRMLRRVISVQKPKNVRTISLSLSLSLSGSALAIKRTSSGSSFPELGGYGHTWSTLTSTVSRSFALLFNAIRLTAGPNSLFRYSLNCRHFAFVFISSELPQMMNPSAPRSVIFRKVASRSACGGKQIHFPEILIARLEPRVSLSKEDKKKKKKKICSPCSNPCPFDPDICTSNMVEPSSCWSSFASLFSTPPSRGHRPGPLFRRSSDSISSKRTEGGRLPTRTATTFWIGGSKRFLVGLSAPIR